VPVTVMVAGQVWPSSLTLKVSELPQPPVPLVAALAGFNLGIELVQLTLALIAFAAMFAISRPGLAMPRLPAGAFLPLASLVIFGFSAYWFVDRSFLLVRLP